MSKHAKSFLNIIIVCVIAFATFYVILKGKDLGQIWSIIRNTHPLYIALGCACACIFIVSEGFNTFTLLRTVKEKTRLVQGIKYASIGFFFSAITPSSTGGQPMQIYYMKKDGVSIASSTLTLVIELMSYQLATLVLAFGLLALRAEFVWHNVAFIRPFLIFGAIVSTAGVLFFLGVLISDQLIRRFAAFIIRVLHSIRLVKHPDKSIEKTEQHIQRFKDGFELLKSRPKLIVQVFLTTMIQLIARYTIIFCVYKALGVPSIDYLSIMALQANFALAMCSLPMPGAIGVNEASFLQIYRAAFSSQNITSALLMHRGVSFYLLVIVAGLISFVNHIRTRDRWTKSIQLPAQAD